MCKSTMYVLCVTLLLLFAQKSSQFTFDEFEKALLSSENDDLCRKEYQSLDSFTKFKFFDASAKIPDGALQGHFTNLGAYDECTGIEIPEKDVLGKYCLATMDVMDMINGDYNQEIHKKITFLSNITKAVLKTTAPGPPLKMTFSGMPASFGICIPHHCATNYVFEKILKLTFDESSCATKNTFSTMTTEAQVALYILIAFVVVAIVSTIYDLVRIHNNKEPAHDILIAFSLYTNSKKLCQSSNNPNQLLCLNGIKTINMFWVITGHFIMNTARGPIDNTLDLIPWYTSYSSMIFVGATVSVDSFFTISGLLSVYTLLRSKDPGFKENIKGIPMLYVHRYLRLTPAFAIIIYIYWSGILNYVSDGPQWFETDSLGTACRDYWWIALLYFQNYSHTSTCVFQSWYLSVDMQLFLLSPLVWIPLRRWPKATLKGMFGLAILGIIVPFVIGYCYKLPAMLGGYPDNGFATKYYFAMHTRFGPYVIGMIAGYFVFHAKKAGKTRISPPALVWLWATVIVLGYACIYAGFPLIKEEAIDYSFQPKTDVDEGIRWWNAVYLGFNRSLWSVAISLLIYLCVTGNGGPVDWFLSVGPMQFMAKLSYCIYLNHIIILSIKQYQLRAVFHFGNYEMINQLISLIVLSIPLGICQTLLFESPMIIIEKILFGKNKPKAAPVKAKAEA